MAKINIQNKRIVAIAVVAVLAIVVVAIVMMRMIPSIDKGEPITPVEDIQSAALTFSDNSDVAGGMNYYDEQIEARSDESDKRALLLYKANFAETAGLTDEALSAAKQADAISTDIATSQTLARIYELQGNKEQAIFYYRKLLEMSPKEGMGSRYNPVWEEKIKELEQ